MSARDLFVPLRRNCGARWWLLDVGVLRNQLKAAITTRARAEIEVG